jgi:hypothetical protein
VAVTATGTSCSRSVTRCAVTVISASASSARTLCDEAALNTAPPANSQY